MVTTIEELFILFKEQKETILRDAVEPAEMALGLVLEAFNPVDMVLASDKWQTGDPAILLSVLPSSICR